MVPAISLGAVISFTPSVKAMSGRLVSFGTPKLESPYLLTLQWPMKSIMRPITRSIMRPIVEQEGGVMASEIVDPVLTERGLRYRRNILLVSPALLLIHYVPDIDASKFAPFGLAVGDNIWWIGAAALVFQMLIYLPEMYASWKVWRPKINFAGGRIRNLFGIGYRHSYSLEGNKIVAITKLIKTSKHGYEKKVFRAPRESFFQLIWRTLTINRLEEIDTGSGGGPARMVVLVARARYIEFVLVDVLLVFLSGLGALRVSAINLLWP